MFNNNTVNRFNSIQFVGLSLSGVPGVSVVPGTSSANGSWTTWATATKDVYGIWININSGFTSGVAKNHTIDIGVDYSGGSSYAVLLQDLLCGYSYGGNNAALGYERSHFFPLYLPAGTAIAVRARGSHTTAGTLKVFGRLLSEPSNPELLNCGTRTETLGYTTNTLGTAFTTTTRSTTPNTWTSLGTTSFQWKHIQLAIQTNSAAYNGVNVFYPEVAYGDGTNYTRVLYDVQAGTIFNSESAVQILQPTAASWCNIPSGATVYIRSKCMDGNTLNTGYSAVVVGTGV